MNIIWSQIIFFELAYASRIPLSDGALPFLSINSLGSTLLEWNNGAVLDILQAASLVEISPRGLRFVYKSHLNLKNLQPMAVATDGHCKAHRGCLCTIVREDDGDMDFDDYYDPIIFNNNFEGYYMPSPSLFISMLDYHDNSTVPQIDASSEALVISKNISNIINNGSIWVTSRWDLLKSTVLASYASASNQACASNGQGRFFISMEEASAVVYTVSGCDILQGHTVAMYYPQQDRMILVKQTFGPMAYTVILLVSRGCSLKLMNDMQDTD